jgi:predicted transcriptional regulator
MATSIKVTEKTKKKLDMLQAKLTLSTGKKMPLQEIIDKISDLAIRHEKELSKRQPPLEKDPAWKKAIDWGVKTDASKVDEYLYV